MNRGVDLKEQNQIFLQMELKKGSLQPDENGNWIFDVEASNENLDMEGQRVLKQALLNSKDYFLTNGVVSKDHLHQKVKKEGGIIFDESYVIGEPKKVYVEDGKVRVRGCLYKSNGYAQEFAKLLNDNSTRVKASVGGLFPKVVKRKENGVDVGNVVSVLWNDLALTIAPVNPTVSPAVMVKSLSSFEFVKSLSAGYGTDSATFTGGRALQGENVEHEKVNLVLNNEEAIASLIGAITDGDVEDLEEAEEFLSGYGISKALARDVIREIVEKRKEFTEVLPMAKGNLWDEVTGRLRKALGGGDGGDVDPDKLEQENGGEKEPGKKEDGGGDGDGDETQDATPILKALSEHIEKLEETNEVIAKSFAALVEQNQQNAMVQKSIGEGVLALMDQKAGTPDPRRSAVSALDAILKGGFGTGAAQPGATGVAGVRHRQFTIADLDEAKDILCKAVADKKLTTLEAGRAETQINKSISTPGFQIDEKFVAILRGTQAKA